MTDAITEQLLVHAVQFHQAGRLNEAESLYQQLLSRDPDSARACNGIAMIRFSKGEHETGLSLMSRAVELTPGQPEYHYNLGNMFNELARFDEAIASFSNAVKLNPDFIEAHTNLGSVLKDVGRLDEALAHFQAATDRCTTHRGCHSNRLYALYFSPHYDAKSIYDEHRNWNQQFARHFASQIRPHENDRNPDRRLRIGYVSPDLRFHPVGRFLVPLLTNHDRKQIEMIGYSAVEVTDEVTDKLKSATDIWRQVRHLSDDQLAEQIRQDRIDILVDLSLHMGGQRLLVFARKPAPVQVTYLSYCGTSGLDTIDYRLTDPHLDPPGMDETCYSEKSFRLAKTYWCYEPCIATPNVNELPAKEFGAITFGSFNNYCKVSPDTWNAWQQLLSEIPSSRLMVYSPPGSHRQTIRDQLKNAHLDPQRLIFVNGGSPEYYFQLYHRVDIALDPFPYGGGTTTCDALWMGVPAVTLRGKTAVGRGGVSSLNNVGLTHLIAENTRDYVKIAADLAGDWSKLADLRKQLRHRMKNSPLMDAHGFTREIESAYRQMWRRWCQPNPT
jgi:protein O-GlcNAc transferase